MGRFDIGSMLFNVSSPQSIAVVIGLLMFLLIVLFAVLQDERRRKEEHKPRNPDEWLFSRWEDKLYDALTKRPPEEMLLMMGVEVERYLKNCNVGGIYYPELKKVFIHKILGLCICLFSALLGLWTRGILLMVIGLLSGLYLYSARINKAKKKAAEKRAIIVQELPRFIDLLQTALYINMPVEEAIVVTSKHLQNTLIAREMLSTMAEMQVGAHSWQNALRNMAEKFEVNLFSDFVMALVTGYEKGLSIYEIVTRQSRDIKQYTLIKAEENANRVNNQVLLPITIFKLLPLLAIVAIPIVLQMQASVG